MLDWLKILGLTIISPTRGLSEAYSRSPFIPAIILLFITQCVYYFYLFWNISQAGTKLSVFLLIYQAVMTAFIVSLVMVALFVPILIAITNIVERRGNLTQVVQQEFSSTASTFSYAYIAVNLLGLILMFVINQGGWAAKFAGWIHKFAENLKVEDPKQWESIKPQIEKMDANPELFFLTPFWLLVIPITLLFIMWAVRAAFRMPWVKTILITIFGIVLLPILFLLFTKPIGFVLGSPLLLLLSFFLLQGYFREIARRRQAQTDFKRNLEIATLNPADASAHYNLGLLYQQRNNIDEAKKCFEKAVEIDEEEIDAHYQLGRIARQQNRLQDAINHFSQVVSRSQNHAQYEIWREIGTTYLSANQYGDAKDALEKFLAERPSDPEGLYLMGQTQAGLGDKRAAISFMQACIEAVKTSPNYKYRIDKRWMSEAEKFLKTNA